MLADALWSDARRRTASRPVATTHKTFTKPSSCFYVFKVKIQLTRVRIIVNKINRVDARILTMFSRVTLGTKGHQRSPFRATLGVPRRRASRRCRHSSTRPRRRRRRANDARTTMVELKKLLIGGLAATAMLADGAHAFTKYSEMSSNTLGVTTTIDGGACAAGSVRVRATAREITHSGARSTREWTRGWRGDDARAETTRGRISVRPARVSFGGRARRRWRFRS